MPPEDYSHLPGKSPDQDHDGFWNSWGMITAVAIAAFVVAVFLGLVLLLTNFGLGWE